MVTHLFFDYVMIAVLHILQKWNPISFCPVLTEFINLYTFSTFLVTILRQVDLLYRNLLSHGTHLFTSKMGFKELLKIIVKCFSTVTMEMNYFWRLRRDGCKFKFFCQKSAVKIITWIQRTEIFKNLWCFFILTFWNIFIYFWISSQRVSLFIYSCHYQTLFCSYVYKHEWCDV